MQDINIAKNQDPALDNKLHQLAQKYCEMIRELSGQDLSFNEAGVHFLDQWIEHVKSDGSTDELKHTLTEMAGAFFGECLRHDFGGKWLRLDDGNVMLAFHLDQTESLNAVNVMPFNKVMNQFENGRNDTNSVTNMYALLAIRTKKISSFPKSLDQPSLHEISIDSIQEGKKILRVNFSPSSEKADDKVLYATTLTNISQERLRVLQFGGYLRKNQTSWLLNNIGGQLFSNYQFTEWYGQKSAWIKPGESVCDGTNHGFPPLLWGYHFETFDGKRYSTGALLKEYPSETLARQVKLSKESDAERNRKNPVTTFGKQALKWLLIVVVLFFVVIYVTFSLASYKDKYGGIESIQVALS